MISKINCVLYNTVPKVSPEDDEKSQLPKNIEEGHRIQHIRFLPTYLDRQPFYNLVLGNDKYSRYLKLNHLENSLNSATLVNIYESKKYFDDRVNALPINRLGVLYNDLLTKFSIVYTGIPSEHMDKGFFLYQWLFEKQFLAATLLQNNRPGEHHLPCELFKNYIMSFFIALDIETQERVYLQWNAMEKQFGSMREFNLFLTDKTDEPDRPGEFYEYRKLADMIA